MRYRKQDKNNGDYCFGTGLNDFYVDQPEAVAQAIDSRLGLWLGEWFGNTSEGTGWTQAILGKDSQNLYELMLRQRVLETTGVVSIEQFESSMNTQARRLKVSMVVNTIYGLSEISGIYQ